MPLQYTSKLVNFQFMTNIQHEIEKLEMVLTKEMKHVIAISSVTVR